MNKSSKKNRQLIKLVQKPELKKKSEENAKKLLQKKKQELLETDDLV
jgi:hypothetical protein